jgi:hypothetical protein
MGSAQSKYSRRRSTQKYMVLNSSGRQMIRAPRPAACRTRRMALSRFIALSTCPANCTPAILSMGTPFSYRNAGATLAAQSRRKRSLSSKWTLIQNCRAPASAAASSFSMHWTGVPTNAKRSAR